MTASPPPDAVVEQLLGNVTSLPGEVRGDWARYVEGVVAEMWERPLLSRRDRCLISIAALAALRCPTELRTHVRLARSVGIERETLAGVMLQVGGYAGTGVAVEGLRVLAAEFESEDESELESEDGSEGDARHTADSVADVRARARPMSSMDARLEQSRAVLAQLRPQVPARPPWFAPDWPDWIRANAFGDLWARTDLTLVEREQVTLAVLIALGRDDQLRIHLRIARNLGMTPAMIGEVMLHLAVYAGFPAAVSAFEIGNDVLADDEAG